MTTNLRRSLSHFYHATDPYFANLKKRSQADFAEYVALVAHFVRSRGKVLDLGCGTGQSSFLLARRGLAVTGGDLSKTYINYARRRYRHPSLNFKTADALNLPFPDRTFDAVAGFEFIEHLPDMPRALEEIIRVTKKGGHVILVGPNLCSPLFGLLDFTRQIAGGPPRPVWAESKGEALRWALTNFRLTLSKLFNKEPQFLYRKPDLSGRIIGADADSVYLACPIDLAKYFRARGASLIQLSGTPFSFKDRLIGRLLPRWAPGIKLVIRK